ncbi:unnamed protein product [Soboliphyme baturini]|uniref:Neur_chan_LBD domain-containing protein n=1 Tax=Soboliphyme baturini TaxID=241478 RepID=A0A183JBD1_9BILA|nr:unnamed protein product [Soboliphyme baturini]
MQLSTALVYDQENWFPVVQPELLSERPYVDLEYAFAIVFMPASS